MRIDFVASGRAVSDIKAHLVSTTKHRHDVFTGDMLTRLGEVLSDLCQKWDCKMIEFNGESTHIHLLFQHYPQMELPKFINNIKSVASRRIRSEFSNKVTKVYWKDVLNESYFIASCGGGVTVSILKQYIEGEVCWSLPRGVPASGTLRGQNTGHISSWSNPARNMPPRNSPVRDYSFPLRCDSRGSHPDAHFLGRARGFPSSS